MLAPLYLQPIISSANLTFSCYPNFSLSSNIYLSLSGFHSAFVLSFFTFSHLWFKFPKPFFKDLFQLTKPHFRWLTHIIAQWGVFFWRHYWDIAHQKQEINILWYVFFGYSHSHRIREHYYEKKSYLMYYYLVYVHQMNKFPKKLLDIWVHLHNTYHSLPRRYHPLGSS